jgi:hypothetical protein
LTTQVPFFGFASLQGPNSMLFQTWEARRIAAEQTLKSVVCTPGSSAPTRRRRSPSGSITVAGGAAFGFLPSSFVDVVVIWAALALALGSSLILFPTGVSIFLYSKTRD